MAGNRSGATWPVLEVKADVVGDFKQDRMVKYLYFDVLVYCTYL